METVVVEQEEDAEEDFLEQPQSWGIQPVSLSVLSGVVTSWGGVASPPFVWAPPHWTNPGRPPIFSGPFRPHLLKLDRLYVSHPVWRLILWMCTVIERTCRFENAPFENELVQLFGWKLVLMKRACTLGGWVVSEFFVWNVACFKILSVVGGNMNWISDFCSVQMCILVGNMCMPYVNRHREPCKRIVEQIFLQNSITNFKNIIPKKQREYFLKSKQFQSYAWPDS